ncbi:MAG: hypothetical protein J0H98_03550 [Solirubrobacterales bacterium]|nr:hypothetical protein [Solirubrobacterales bacterium]
MNRSRFTRLAILALGLALAVGVASPAAAKVKPKDGAYYQALGKQSGYIITEKGKITGVSATLKFKLKNGKTCIPEGLYDSDGVAGVYFAPKRPVAPKRTNRFSFKGTKQTSYPKLKTSISGRLVNANKAAFTIKARQGGCSAQLTLKRAKYTAGG